MKRSTLAGILVLAALGAYIYWFEREPVSEDEERIFDVEASAIDRVELRDHDDAPVVLERADEGWRLVAPLEAEADETEVDLLLQNLATASFERAVARASEVGLDAYGLDEPRVRVRFQASGASHGLDFGADTPTSGNQYARPADGEDVLVVPSYLSTNFQKTAWDLRDKRVFPALASAEEEPAPTRVEIDRVEGRILLVREDGVWLLREPYPARADRLEVTGLVGRFRRAEMEQVVAEAPEGGEDHGLSEPRLALRVELEGEAEPLLVELGDERELEVVARTPSRPQIFLLDEAYASDLSRGPGAFVAKRLLDTPVFEVARLTVDGRSFEKRTSGDEESWRQTAPEEREVPTSLVEDLLFELSATSAEVVEAPELEAFGLDAPDHTLVLVSGEPARETRLGISAPAREGASAYALREGDAVALELTEEAWSELAPLLSMEIEAPEEDDAEGER